jgi:hypothetical protein
MKRVVAAFNGGFKTEHGEFGMMVEGDILVPPVDNAATVATMADGSILLGSWPSGERIPEEMVSFRQNLDPLVEDDVVNPRRRSTWGYVLKADLKGMYTIRSGLCRHRDGYLIYLWGGELSAGLLGKSMKTAGCDYGMHLDMNPYHTVFTYLRFHDDVTAMAPEFDYHIPIADIVFNPPRYVYRSPKDFFFVTLKQFGPGEGWHDEEMAQPAPAEAPAVFKREVNGCRFLAFDVSRIRLAIDGGEIPRKLLPTPDTGSEADERYLLASIDLGPWTSSRGQMVGGIVVAGLKTGQPAVMINANGELLIKPWSRSPRQVPIMDAVQTRWLFEETDPRSQVIAIGCNDEWLLVGSGRGVRVAEVMKRHGISEAAAFPGEGQSSRIPKIMIRETDAVVDWSGTPIFGKSAEKTYLQIYAAPRLLGAASLSKAF